MKRSPLLIASSLTEQQNERLAVHVSNPTILKLGEPWQVPAEAQALFTYQTRWRDAPVEPPAGWPGALTWAQSLRLESIVPMVVLRYPARQPRPRRAGTSDRRICQSASGIPAVRPFNHNPSIRLTPHISGSCEDGEERLSAFLARNFPALLVGSGLRGSLTPP